MPEPCWSEAFPNMTHVARKGPRNELTCDICTNILQGLDDFLLNNEDQVGRLYNCICIIVWKIIRYKLAIFCTFYGFLNTNSALISSV